MKLKLTSSFCRDINCSPGKRKEVYRCTEVIGFGLEVRPSGKKTYYLYYTNASGKATQIKIGGHVDISFEVAKRKAKELRSQVVLGGDPGVDKAINKAVPTFAELSRMVIEHSQHLRSHASIEMTHRRHLVPEFGRQRIDAITPQAIEKFLAERRETMAPASVDKIRVVMNRCYQLSAKWSLPGSERNPVSAVARPRYDNRREKFLTATEAERLITACGESENPMLKPIVQLLLATGARKREVLDSKWEHLDRERGTLLFPVTKNGRSRRIPLSQVALDVIDALPRLCDYLVPNPATLRPFDNLKRSWATACKASGLSGLRIHDLRHSAMSAMIAGGIDLYTAGKVLGHLRPESSARYAHVQDSSLRAAVEAGAAKLNL